MFGGYINLSSYGVLSSFLGIELPELYHITMMQSPEFHNNADYLFLRSKIFFINELYYLAVDTLLIALEFEQNDKTYNLLGEIYKILENHDLSKKILNVNLRKEAVNSVKDELTGIYRKK